MSTPQPKRTPNRTRASPPQTHPQQSHVIQHGLPTPLTEKRSEKRKQARIATPETGTAAQEVTTEQKGAPPVPQRVLEQSSDQMVFRIAQPPNYIKTQDYFSACLAELAGGKGEDDKDSDEVFEGLIQKFAKKHFGFEIPETKKGAILPALRKDLKSEAVKIIAFVADGGPKGKGGWEELFFDPELRAALVFAIVGLVLQEHVFGSLCFGATDEQIDELHENEIAQVGDQHDGFSRTAARAKKIAQFITEAERATGRSKYGLAPTMNFRSASAQLTWQLYTLLWPIMALDPHSKQSLKPTSAAALKTSAFEELYVIVTTAARVHLRMRLDGGTVYHCITSYTNEIFNHKETLIVNLREMEETVPPSTPSERDRTDKGMEALQEEANAVPLVRVSCWGIWRAWKKGGWLKEEKDMGVRERTIGKGWNVLRWGLKMAEGAKNMDFFEALGREKT